MDRLDERVPLCVRQICNFERLVAVERPDVAGGFFEAMPMPRRSERDRVTRGCWLRHCDHLPSTGLPTWRHKTKGNERDLLALVNL